MLVYFTLNANALKLSKINLTISKWKSSCQLLFIFGKHLLNINFNELKCFGVYIYVVFKVFYCNRFLICTSWKSFVLQIKQRWSSTTTQFLKITINSNKLSQSSRFFFSFTQKGYYKYPLIKHIYLNIQDVGEIVDNQEN